MPIKGQSSIVIIHEYKVCHNFDKIEAIVEEAMWQIFVNQYMSKVLSLAKAEDNLFWEFIIVRALVFYKDKLASKWSITMKEFKFSVSNASQLNKLFSNNGKLLDNVD